MVFSGFDGMEIFGIIMEIAGDLVIVDFNYLLVG